MDDFIKFLFKSKIHINFDIIILNNDYFEYQKNFQIIKTDKQTFYYNKTLKISVWENPENIYRILKYYKINNLPLYWINIDKTPLILIIFESCLKLFNRNNNLIIDKFPLEIIYNYKNLPYINSYEIKKNKTWLEIINKNISPKLIYQCLNKSLLDEEKLKVFKESLNKFFKINDEILIKKQYENFKKEEIENKIDDNDKENENIMSIKKLMLNYKRKNKFSNYKSFLIKYKNNDLIKKYIKYLDLDDIFKKLKKL